MKPQRRRAPREDRTLIRTARPTDLEALVRLWTEFVSYHERIGRERLAPQGAEIRVRGELRSDISARGACLLVAEFDGEVVGYVLGRLHPVPPMYEGQRLGVVDELVVTERQRLHGIGHLLARHVMEWFQSKRADRVELTILEENEEARAFWERTGFRLSGLRYEHRF